MTIKVGDYVRAQLITEVPPFEVDVDMTREGLVVELRDNGSELVLQNWLGNEFRCYAKDAVVVDQSTLDESIITFIADVMRHTG